MKRAFGPGYTVAPGSGEECVVRQLIGEQAWKAGGGWDVRVYWVRGPDGVWVVGEVRS